MVSEPQTLYPGVTLHKSLASRVFLNRDNQTAVKVYSPPAPVKLLYWLAFQAPFPYVHNENALLAASARRRIAGLLTRFWYGRDLVSPVLAVAHNHPAYAYVTRLIEGRMPADKKRARAFLADLASRFQEVGLPTWQINPRNPRADENLIETPEGDYVIIDLESAVVSPVMPPGQWLDALKAGLLPVFDDLFLQRTRAYVEKYGGLIREALGEQGLSDLRGAIDDYETHWHDWRRVELRLWARLFSSVSALVRGVGRLLKPLWLPGSIPSLLRALRQASSGQLVQTLVTNGVAQWREEGILEEDTANEIERSLRSPDVYSALRHLSAHAAISVPLRFPIGSLARVSWTLAFRAKAEWRALVRRQSDDETRSARRTHTAAVALIAAVPGIGGAAYLAAEQLRKNRPLLALGLDQLLRKSPASLYRRMHLGALTRWLASPSSRRRAGGGVEQPRPSGWLKPLRASARGLNRHRQPIAIVFGATAVAMVVGEVYQGSGQAVGDLSRLAPIAGSAIAGTTGILAYRLFWRDPNAEGDVGAAAGSFFWLISGAGLTWLAIDVLLQIHERLGSAADAVAEIPLLNGNGDAIVLGYAVAAILLIAVFKGELTRSPTIAAPLAGSAVSALVVLALRFLGPESTPISVLDYPAGVMASGFLTIVYVIKYREIAAAVAIDALPRPATRQAPVSKPDSPVPTPRVGPGELGLPLATAVRREDS